MKVYLVQSSYGAYEDHSLENEGVFSKHELAEDVAQKIRDGVRSVLDKGDPWSEIEEDEFDNLPLGEQEEIWSLYTLYKEARDFNQSYVTEFELDKRV